MKKQNLINWIVTILFLIALAVIYCFWGCKWDLIVTIIAGLVAVISICTLSFQNKKIKDLTGDGQ